MRIGAFTWRLGERREIDSLPELSADPRRLQRMKKHGLACFMEATQPREGLMVEALQASVRESGMDPLSIDTVIYATGTFDDREDAALMPVVLRRCGLLNARPIGVFLGFCANFTYAFEAIEGLRALGRSRNALLLFSDAYPAGRTRLIRQDSAVGSDGVACCVVSDALERGYDVGPVRHHYDAQATEHLETGDIVSYVRAYSNGVRTSAEAALAAAEVGAAECRWLVTANFNRSVLRNISELCGIGADRIYDRNIGELGHCSSADQLIALGQLLESDLPASTPLLVTGPADTVWGAAAMRVVRPVSMPAGEAR
ncbi:hypothetical protein D7W79_19525 [Corallococcus exercitus]|uniref:3-oxoacyl-[acyl-carrier-protein] synthase III C-terminal domain-containing protein n=1 Tax=Corallococcus exercitus TaxID=2316736 RepID=UPI000EA33F86|nr:3-oxoacyl-[acyl-carrier-protein] synthase III C-terminal domain-containing protein [Corallococcus exercitus]RKG75788.1 hypothetical protein D7W79_19525 [Corallococcus exercitus]